jgi:hypothetical protein
MASSEFRNTRVEQSAAGFFVPEQIAMIEFWPKRTCLISHPNSQGLSAL